ncbi:MAG: aminodeoxychorismate lyase [Pseudomonadota bacterium]
MTSPELRSVITYVDDERIDRLPADDRGLAYGDGLFETVAVAGGVPRLLSSHLDRLLAGAARLAIPVQRSVVERRLRHHARELGDGVIRYTLTRGSGPRGYAPPRAPTPRHLLQQSPREAGFADAWWSPTASPIAVRTCRTRLSVNPALGGLKHLNRLPQVLARGEWSDPHVAEGLMRADASTIVCATAANVFALVAERLYTPGLERAGVDGVMRRAIMELAPSVGLDVHVEEKTLAFLTDEANAVFLSSALTGVRLVWRIDDATIAAPDARLSALAPLARLRLALGEHLGIERAES